MLKREVVEDIAVLLRGFFAAPMISTLGRMGILEAMASAESFSAGDFPSAVNKKLFEDTLRYFLRIGLLESAGDGRYAASELGKEIFRRANSFYVPHSYFEYMYRYDTLMKTAAIPKDCAVERLENVIGSGKTHERYFPPVVSYLKRKTEFDVIVDIGCGDGGFLSRFLDGTAGKRVVAIDLSRLSTEETGKNLRARFPGLEITTVCCDALDVASWGAQVRRAAGNGKVAISMWFLLHEISGNSPERLVKFFREIHAMFPAAPIAVGEVVRQSEDILASNSHRSIMAEYLFFHEMSGQGILSWDGYKSVLKAIPYTLKMERLYDESPGRDGARMPSAFTWCLDPQQEEKTG